MKTVFFEVTPPEREFFRAQKDLNGAVLFAETWQPENLVEESGNK